MNRTRMKLFPLRQYYLCEVSYKSDNKVKQNFTVMLDETSPFTQTMFSSRTLF